MSPPVLFLIFNRPEKALAVFDRIRDARPAKLFIAADGPRKIKLGEVALCKQTRKAILDLVDWPCELSTLFRDENLGCKLAVSSAISWFFEHVEEGIILEDDCLPDASFFKFSGELLEKFRFQDNVMMISGSNFRPDQQSTDSYLFSRHTAIWGWASWRRAWRHYDLAMAAWPDYREHHRLENFLPSSIARRRNKQFENAFRGNCSTWDTQWLFACWNAGGVSVVPAVNLVVNIDSAGTHTKLYDPFIHQPSGVMTFPLQHPGAVHINRRLDEFTQRYAGARPWYTNLRLIVGYLLRVLLTHPSHLLQDTATIAKSVSGEIHSRAGR